jgi:hypothetical protein
MPKTLFRNRLSESPLMTMVRPVTVARPDVRKLSSVHIPSPTSCSLTMGSQLAAPEQRTNTVQAPGKTLLVTAAILRKTFVFDNCLTRQLLTYKMNPHNE